jgi:hypothetical protein
MRRSDWTPSIVPNGNDQTVYFVMDDLGRGSRIWPDADVENTDLEVVINDLLGGQYRNPVCIIAFNTGERWSQDVSEDVAQELRQRCDLAGKELPENIQDFVERHSGKGSTQLTLRLG